MECSGYPTFEETHEALFQGNVDYAMVPIENSLGGSIHANYDQVLSGYEAGIRVIGEYQLRISHCLLVLPGVKETDLKTVISHPQGLAQCRSYLQRLQLKAEPYYDTAGAAQALARKKCGFDPKTTAAIASLRAGKEFGLVPLATDIQDDHDNITRFILIGKNYNIKTISSNQVRSHYKTSLAFAADADHQAGALAKCLQVFVLREVNVLRLESRPCPRDVGVVGSNAQSSFKFIFFVDLEGALEDKPVSQAISHLKDICPLVRILGSYPAAVGVSEPGRADKALKNIVLQDGGSIPMAPTDATKMKVGLIGYGTFGRFVARRLLYRGHRVYITSRTDYSREVPTDFKPNLDISWLLNQNIDVLVIATSIQSFESVISKIDFAKLNNCIVVDTLSVKQFPRKVLLEQKNSSFGILCTHPVFGPQSGSGTWKDLPFMYERVRLVNVEQQKRAEMLIKFFADEGCRTIDMDCATHDTLAAETQFLTHLTGRVLEKQHCRRSALDTTGYTSLLSVMENTCKDSFDLFEGLYEYNDKAEKQMTLFKEAFDDISMRLRRGRAQKMGDDSWVVSEMSKKLKPSSTTGMLSRALQRQREGNPTKILSVGQPDYTCPPWVTKAMQEAAGTKATCGYSSMQGDPQLRAEIAKRYNLKTGEETYKADDVFMVAGLKLGLYQLVAATCGPGDEVLLPSPTWVSYAAMATMAGASYKFVPADLASDKPYPTAEAIRSGLTSKTKLIILGSPSNPTGTMIPPEEAKKIVSLLMEPEWSNVYIVMDEIYDELVFVGKCPSWFDARALGKRFILANGFSKSFAMCGLRIGYLITTHPLIMKTLQKIGSQTHSNVNNIAQVGALAGLKHPDTPKWLTERKEEMRQKSVLLVQNINKAKRPIIVTKPEGAFYVMMDVRPFLPSTTPQGRAVVDALSFAEGLLEEKDVAAVSSDDFGLAGWLRISYATSSETLIAGGTAIAEFVDSLKI